MATPLCPVQGFETTYLAEDQTIVRKAARAFSGSNDVTEDNYFLARSIPKEELQIIMRTIPAEDIPAFIEGIRSEVSADDANAMQQLGSFIYGFDLAARLNKLQESQPTPSPIQRFQYSSSTDSLEALLTTEGSRALNISTSYSVDDLLTSFGLTGCDGNVGRYSLASAMEFSGENLTVGSGTDISWTAFAANFTPSQDPAAELATNYGPPSALWIGKKIPLDLSVTTLDGTQDSLVPTDQQKPVLITCWASWCGYCLEERKDFGKEDNPNYLHVYLSFDQTQATSISTLTQLNALESDGLDRWASPDVADQLQLNAFPMNIIVSPNGTVIDVIPGSVKPSVIDSILSAE
jgi:thiol-disulfide isomerase/thioredoxin